MPTPTITASNGTSACNNVPLPLASSGTFSTYQWNLNGNPIAGATSSTYSATQAGNYSLSVSNANGCFGTSANTAVTFNALPTISGNSKLCLNSNMQLSGSGSPSASNPWVSSNTSVATVSNSGLVSAVSAGSSTITYKDVNGCSVTKIITVNATPTFSFGITNVTNCTVANGQITFTPIAGTAPFTYSIDNGATFQTANVFSDLAAGSYSILIKDADGCVSQTNSVSVQAPSNFPSVNGATPTNSLCFGTNTGSISFTGNGGTSPYTFSIDNGATYVSSGNFSNLAPGTYQVKVKDANTCQSSAVTVNVFDANQINVSPNVSQPLCSNNLGTVALQASGGSGSFTYSQDGDVYQSNNSFSNLSAGTYTFVVKDGNGCTKLVNATITTPSQLASTIDSQVNVICKGDATGSVSIIASGGTPIYTISPNQSGLTAGLKVFTITDANGCTKTQNVTITEPATTIIITGPSTMCVGETIQLTPGSN